MGFPIGVAPGDHPTLLKCGGCGDAYEVDETTHNACPHCGSLDWEIITPTEDMDDPQNAEYWREPGACGWFHINRKWDLYVDGDLQSVHVKHIHVTPTDDGDEYHVDHYDPLGEFITDVTITADDLEKATRVGDRTGKPENIDTDD